MHNIRCSMLPGWADCQRRAAAKQYGKLIAERGYTLRKLPPSIGAAVGTAVHEAFATMLRSKRDGKSIDIRVALEGAGQKFREEVENGGVEWDETTKNRNDAFAQIESLTRAAAPLVHNALPVLVEDDIRARISDAWMLTGRVDLFDEGGALDDLKTGALPRPYIQQAGGYVLALEANGHTVTAASNTFIKRVRPGKPQPAPVRTDFDLGVARGVAYATIQDITGKVDRFAESGDPSEMLPNPMSLMCSAKYCPAHGTDFCKVHRC